MIADLNEIEPGLLGKDALAHDLLRVVRMLP